MAKFVKYPKIGQYRNLVEGLRLHLTYVGRDENGEPIYDESRKLDPIKFTGTVKLHGTNAGFSFRNDEIWFQKREDIVTPLADNYGFAGTYSSSDRIAKLKEMAADIRTKFAIPEDLILSVFGEWTGKGIQRGVGISQLDRAFYIFGIKTVNTEDEDKAVRWYPIDGFKIPEIRVFNIKDYGTYEVTVDLHNPEAALDQLTQERDAVEQECPVAKAFGVEKGLGEGIVYSAVIGNDLHSFKIKGDKHSSVKLPKEKVAVDAVKLGNIEEFIEYAVTENRLQQAFDQLFTGPGLKPDKRHTGDMIKWMTNDIATEEIDTLVKNGLTLKDVGGGISAKTREWFFKVLGP